MLIYRSISTIFLLACFFIIFFYKGTIGMSIFILIGGFLSITSTYELSSILKKIGFAPYFFITEMFSIIFFVTLILERLTVFVNLDITLLLISTFSIFFWLNILFSKFDKDVIMRSAATSFVALAIIIPLNAITLVYLKGYGKSYIGISLALFLILVTKFGDIGAYCIGVLSSKLLKGKNHKIVPKISPKKSWEGTIGGCIVSIITAFILAYQLNISFFVESNFLIFIIGILLFLGGFCGDLAESVLKRVANIKDSGNSIPGIGGCLDLIDSLIFNAPIFYIILKITNCL